MFNLKIVTPQEQVFEDMVEYVSIPSSTGQIGILKDHINLMSKIIPGELFYKKDGKGNYLAVGEGFIKVYSNKVLVMTDLAKHPQEIDEKIVEEARQRAKEALEQKLSDEEYAITWATLEKALAQLKVKRRHRAS